MGAAHEEVLGPVSVEELVEEVDEHGAVVRVVTRGVMRADRLRHRAVYIVVLSTDGRLLVHRRADDKDVWPSRWDMAAGGVVGVDEPWEDAARRELAEELGIDARAFEHLGGGVVRRRRRAALGEVYLVVSDGPFHFADGEVAEARPSTATSSTRCSVRRSFCPDSIALALPHRGGSPGLNQARRPKCQTCSAEWGHGHRHRDPATAGPQRRPPLSDAPAASPCVARWALAQGRP